MSENKKLAIYLAKQQGKIDDFLDQASDMGIDLSSSSLSEICLVRPAVALLGIDILQELETEPPSETKLTALDIVAESWSIGMDTDKWVEDMILLSAQLKDIASP